MLVLGVGFALLTGLLEVARIGVLRLVLNRITWLPIDAVWMAPVANLIYFLAPILVLFLASTFFPRWVPLWSTTFVFALLSAFSLIMLFGRQRLNVWAIALLALGCAVQLSRLARAHSDIFWRWTVRGTLAMSLVTGALLLGTFASRQITRRAWLSDLPMPPNGARNVLLIILDTVRAASLSLYGYNRPTTPRLEEWSRTGVVFDFALSTAPWTLPSHGSMFTGRWPHEQTSDWLHPLDDAHPTLAEALRDRGYLTAGFVSNLAYAVDDSGLSRGFGYYSAHKFTWKQLLLCSSLGQTLIEWRYNPAKPKYDPKRATTVTAEFLEWLTAERSDSRPFFAFLNYFDAHLPYRSTPEFRAKFMHADRLVGRYDAAIANLDHELDRLFEELKNRGVLENTMVVVTSDHGEHLREHGLTEHANSLYMPLLHVPLVMFDGAAIPAGRRITQPVSLRDLPATILELAAGGNPVFPGHSLSGFWNARSSPSSPLLAEVKRGLRTEPHLPVSRGPMKSLVKDGYHYILNGDGAEELYFLETDPAENHNLATSASQQQTLMKLRLNLKQILAGQAARTSPN